MPMTRRSELRELLASRDLSALASMARATPILLKDLLSLTYDADDLLAWRAVEAVGIAAGAVAQSDLERVRNLVRKLLWSMNDESGGIGWRAPETIGEILARTPVLIAEMGVLLAAFIRQPPFERGAHLAIARAARIDPTPFADAIPDLIASLRDEDPHVRAYAALALGALGDETCRPAIETLKADTHDVERYDFDTHRLETTTVARMAHEALNLLQCRRP
ncbi:MAG: HEAT repeat domain-containing protein [Phycisphaerae bacterium]|nr:HEAT repeat domain-containing protein [Phycisphaerae bacterium]